jgi:hypothetical protein
MQVLSSTRRVSRFDESKDNIGLLNDGMIALLWSIWDENVGILDAGQHVKSRADASKCRGDAVLVAYGVLPPSIVTFLFKPVFSTVLAMLHGMSLCPLLSTSTDDT